VPPAPPLHHLSEPTEKKDPKEGVMTGKIVRDPAVRASAVSGVVIAAGVWSIGQQWPVAVAALVALWAAITAVATATAARR
jgi:hypothetical protein